MNKTTLYELALRKIMKINGRGTTGNIAFLALHPDCIFEVGNWIKDEEIVNDEAFLVALNNANNRIS